MKKKNRFTEVCILDLCYPDYFCGYPYPVLAIPIFGETTNEELANLMESEINSIYEHLEYGYTEEEIKLFDIYIEKLKKEPHIVCIKTANTEEEEDSIYLYMALCKPVTKYGITFLNE